MNKEIKELKNEWLSVFQPPEIFYLQDRDNSLCCPLCGVKAEEIADWWIKRINLNEQRRKT